jgi:ADP-ribose pyrophosphatase YjhB (NUDIX family)
VPEIRIKVYAYITQSDRLLVFSHPGLPEAGLQVPGGSVEPGEALDDAVLREAREESGLEDLSLISYLGCRCLTLRISGQDVHFQCHFYHLEYLGPHRAVWRSSEMTPSDGSPGPIELEFFWVKTPHGLPKLNGVQGALFWKLEWRP